MKKHDRTILGYAVMGTLMFCLACLTLAQIWR